MTISKAVLMFLASLILASCSMSKTFHRPQKMERSIDDYTYITEAQDTTLIQYNKAKGEINFLKPGGELINKGYRIKNTNFLSSSGNRLNSWILTPNEGQPKATILHFHGSAANLFNQFKAIAPLLAHGYQVFTFDYSGYGFSEGKATRKNTLLDAFSALDFVFKHSTVQDEKLLLYGQSYGGYLAAVVGSNRQKKVDGIIIEGAFSTHKAEARYTVPIFGNIVKNEAKAHKEIRKNSKPILVIHSTEDKRVPFKFGKKIFDNANAPKAFYEIDKAHIMGLQYYTKEIVQRIDALMLNE